MGLIPEDYPASRPCQLAPLATPTSPPASFDAEDIAATRAWLALTQLARDDEAIGDVLAPWEAKMVEIIVDFVEQLELDLDPINADLLVAVVHGLRHRVCATQGPLALARAHAVLTHAIALMPESASPRYAGDLTLSESSFR